METASIQQLPQMIADLYQAVLQPETKTVSEMTESVDKLLLRFGVLNSTEDISLLPDDI